MADVKKFAAAKTAQLKALKTLGAGFALELKKEAAIVTCMNKNVTLVNSKLKPIYSAESTDASRVMAKYGTSMEAMQTSMTTKVADMPKDTVDIIPVITKEIQG